jgi:hypothetical protein
MQDETSGSGQLDRELATMIDVLDELTVLQKRFLHSRWLDQVAWMEARAKTAQTRYYALRLVAIVGGVFVPALVGLKLGNSGSSPNWIFWITFFLSLLVAVCVAVEEFFHYGERWRHYRRIVEMLKSEGWQFFQLAGSYQKHENHDEAYSVFAARVEEILHQDIEMFMTQVAQEKKEQAKGDGAREPVSRSEFE